MKQIIFNVLFMLSTFSIIAQTGNNTISIYYTPEITRSYFDKTFEHNQGPFTEFYETTKDFRPLTGHSYGIDYSRNFKNSG